MDDLTVAWMVPMKVVLTDELSAVLKVERTAVTTVGKLVDELVDVMDDRMAVS